MHSSRKKWLQFSLFNLWLVAFLGATLRYKIAFYLPFIDQQNLLHGHSHFAFAGWVTQALMTLLIGYLSEKTSKDYFPRYRWILYFNAITAYGMLISFPIQGYGSVSIFFSTMSVFASYYFAIIFWKDLNRLPVHSVSHSWFKLALLGNVISSAGPFSLAYMMASHNMHQNWYLASLYFYLHFQYNIWFFFSCMGLLSYRLSVMGISEESLKKIFICFALAALPTYFLSVLWWHIPLWLYIVVVLAAVCQLAGWVQFIWLVKKQASLIQKQYHAVFARIVYFFWHGGRNKINPSDCIGHTCHQPPGFWFSSYCDRIPAPYSARHHYDFYSWLQFHVWSDSDQCRYKTGHHLFCDGHYL